VCVPPGARRRPSLLISSNSCRVLPSLTLSTSAALPRLSKPESCTMRSMFPRVGDLHTVLTDSVVGNLRL
jgi:hypothetical protein